MKIKRQTRDSLSRHTISDGTVDHLLDETRPPSSKLQSMSKTPHVRVMMVTRHCSRQVRSWAALPESHSVAVLPVCWLLESWWRTGGSV